MVFSYLFIFLVLTRNKNKVDAKNSARYQTHREETGGLPDINPDKKEMVKSNCLLYKL